MFHISVLGTVESPDGGQLTVADVPGLIEGASEGVGLGHEFLAHLERAQLLLRNHKMSIAEIALATGFAHQSHLARHMHRILGYTPSAVRRKPVKQRQLHAVN